MATDPVIPFDYLEREKRRAQSQQGSDPIADAMGLLHQEQIRSTIIRAPDAASTANVTRVARDAGEPPAMVEDRVADVAKAQQADRFTRVLGQYPAFTGWAIQNPRDAVAASGDHKSLGLIGDAWKAIENWGTDPNVKPRASSNIVGGAGPMAGGVTDTSPFSSDYRGSSQDVTPYKLALRTGAGVSGLVQGTLGVAEAAGEASQAYNPVDWAQKALFGGSVGSIVADLARARRKAWGQTTTDLEQASQAKSVVGRGILSGVESVPGSLAALGVTLATGNPYAGASVLGATTGGQSYGDARDAGLGVGKSLTKAGIDAAIETGTEILPERYLGELAHGAPITKAIGRYLLSELGGEEAATLGQDFNQWAMIDANKGKSFADYAAEIAPHAVDTAIAVLTTGAVMGGAGSLSRILVKQTYEADQAAREKAVFDAHEKAAAGSEYRKLDPEGYAQMVGYVSEAQGRSSVFVPAEAVRAYQQSDAYDQFEDPFSPYQSQIDEAAATGGDVVLPASFALGTLPGTSAWAAVKDDLRLRPGGMSAREADEMNSHLDEMVKGLAEQHTANSQSTAQEFDARSAMVERVTHELQNAGFTPTNAAVQAELIAQRVATRAARLGRNMQPGDFDTRIMSVLPPALAQMQQADNVDLVINAMRTGKDATKQTGKSLLDFIAAKGGIEDRGGNVAAMGGDKWHVGKVGKRKLLKAYNDAQGNMLGSSGSNPNSISNLLDAAISEGYFPELLAMRENGEKIDDRVLLDAIGQELGGSPVYPEAAKVDNVRLAADELRQMLEDQGRDPSGMSDAEIRRAIADHVEAMRGDGTTYEQMPDTLVVDGVERSTRNSEGMPLSRSEEGIRAFWNWFGESRVVDEEGRPLVVYHGTGADIEAFNGITWASAGMGLAQEYASMREVLGQGVATVLPLYMRAERVFDADAGLSKSETVGSFFNTALEQAIEQGREIDLERARALLDTIRSAGKREESGPRYDRHDFWNKSAEMFGRDGAGAIREMFDLMGFDGIKMRENGSDTFGAFSPAQIKSINNRGTFDPADARILYQDAAPSEPLVVIHNLSSDKFRNALELGGLAAPSIAVIRADIDWTNFGDISLVASPDLVDPKKDRAARGFNADVYSPRQPRAQFDLHGPTLKNLRSDMAEPAKALGESFDVDFDPDKLSREGIAAIEASAIAKLAFLRSIGQDVKPVRDQRPEVDKALVKAAKGAKSWQDLMFSDSGFEKAVVEVEQKRLAELEAEGADAEVLRRVRLRTFEYDAAGNVLGVTDSVLRDRARAAIAINQPPPINRWKTREAIDRKIEATKKRPAEFRMWVQDNYAGLIAGRFFETRDSGRRKAYTMENLVREMTRTIRDGEGYNYGVGSLRSNVAKQFRSIAEMQADRGSILSDDAMEKIKAEVSDEMTALAEKFAPYHRSGQDFGWLDIFTSFLKDLSAGRVREWQQDIFSKPAPDALLAEAREFLGKLRGLPTEYFEVKMQRAVNFSEFAGAAVPDDTPKDVINSLRGFGLQVASYPKGGSRQAAIAKIAAGSQRRVLFQSAYHGSPHIFDRFSLDAIGTGEGAQAYGWGLYFAGRKEIAEHYRKALATKPLLEKIEIDSDVFADEAVQLARESGGLTENEAQLLDALEADDFLGFEYLHQAIRAVFKEPDAFDISPELVLAVKNQGRLYQVEIPDDNEYLLWDKPLSEQPEKVRAAIEALKGGDKEVDQLSGDELFAALGGLEQTLGDKEKTGQGFYKELTALKGSDRAASKALHDAGIAGIKYLDGGSRTEGEGSFNYVVFDDSRVSITAYEQSYGEGPRGRISLPVNGFGTGPATIELFQNRNPSTLLHELGHQWLEELRYDANLPGAPDQLKNDWQAVQDWFAANGHPVVDGFIPTEAHELWARGHERYLMEGKSPSSALTRLFETFRGWLLNVYRTVEALRSPISPEIRQVFDRLYATDEEITQRTQEQAMNPLFKDAASAGMTGPEFEAYTEQVLGARDKAHADLLAKTMASIKRRVTKAWNDERRGVLADEAERLDASPILSSLRMMKATPLSLEWLQDRMGQDVTDLLPKRVPPIWREGGANPDSLAEMTGFESGQQMIEVLIGAERQHRQAKEGGDQRTMRERMIQQAADAEMQRRHGDDPFNDGSIEQEAIAAVNNELAGEVLASEIRILSRKTGQRPTPYKIARAWARGKVRGGTVAEEASPGAIQRHARAVAKAGREAEKAMLAGKFDEAQRFKQQQMLSSALLSEAKAAHDEVTSAQARLAKIAKRKTMKSVDQDYLEQAHALLDDIDLGPRSQKSLERQGKWEAWAAAREAEGYDVLRPDAFRPGTHWSKLPVETFLGLDETIKQVLHLGRLKQTLLDNQEQREWDAVFDEAVGGASNISGPPPADLAEPGWWDALKGKVLGVDAALLKMETVFDWLDGGNSNGVFNRIAFRPVADAQAREQDMLKDYYGRIKALFEAVPGEVSARWNDVLNPPFIDVHTERPMRINRKQAVAMALNIGNEGNLQRLSDGYRVNPAAIEQWLNETLTAEEWRFVQGVWDTIDTLWPEIEGLEKRVNGIAPEKVEPRSFATQHGQMRGGYYPAIYDVSRDYKAAENAGKETDLFEGRYTRATTRASSTKERAEKVKRPILLDLGVINRHLGEVIHDITHREAVIQAHKFLSSERVRRAVDQALGSEIGKQLGPWVKFVANSWAQERAGNEGFGRWIGKARANATVVGMGFRATTMVTQIAGYSNSVEVVGAEPLAKAIAQFSSNPVAAVRSVMEKSGEIRHRMDTLDRDLRSEIAKVAAANPASKLARQAMDAKRFMFHGIGYMDMAVSVPTWMAGYSNAIALGMSEADAIYAGDKAVRQSQGAGSPKDLAAIQRGTGKWGEALKLVTMFYSYFSAQYQRERTLGRDIMAVDGRRSRSTPKLVARAFFLLVLPPLLTEVLRAAAGAGNPPDDDEWWTEWVLRKLTANAVGPIPVVRDLIEPVWQGVRGAKVWNPSVTPLQRAMDSIVAAGKDVGHIARGEETKHAVKDLMETAGYVTGLVPGQVASATQFLVDVGNGTSQPKDAWDWIEGLSTGKVKQ